MKKCPNCGAQMNDDSLFCTECGKQIPQGNQCPHCGALLNNGDAFCQNCGKKVVEAHPSIVTETSSIQKKCPQCGAVVDNGDIFCQNCGQSLNVVETDVPSTNFVDHEENTRKTEETTSPQPIQKPVSYPKEMPQVSSPRVQEVTQPVQQPYEYQEPKKSNAVLISIIVLLLLLILGVGGYFYYDNVYLPEKIDREAPRYYSMANVVVLRSSRSAGADFNKVASLPYGTELITYEIDSEWAKVKVNSPNGEKQEGYVASPYILKKSDFFLLNSIFGNQESKETIITTKCRIALLNYFKEKQYIGKIDNQMRIDAGISIVPNSTNQWQVFTKPKDSKPNSVFFKRLYDKNSQFTDFAVLITNSVTKERKLLYFYFDKDETPHLLEEQDAPSDAYISDISYDYDYYYGTKELSVRYSY